MVQSGQDGTLDIEYRNNIAILTMKRGANRCNPDFVEKMHQTLDTIEKYEIYNYL